MEKTLSFIKSMATSYTHKQLPPFPTLTTAILPSTRLRLTMVPLSTAHTRTWLPSQILASHPRNPRLRHSMAFLTSFSKVPRSPWTTMGLSTRVSCDTQPRGATCLKFGATSEAPRSTGPSPCWTYDSTGRRSLATTSSSRDTALSAPFSVPTLPTMHPRQSLSLLRIFSPNVVRGGARTQDIPGCRRCLYCCIPCHPTPCPHQYVV